MTGLLQSANAKRRAHREPREFCAADCYEYGQCNGAKLVRFRKRSRLWTAANGGAVRRREVAHRVQDLCRLRDRRSSEAILEDALSATVLRFGRYSS